MFTENTDLMVFNKDALEVITSTPLFNDEEKKQLQSASESMEKAFYNSQVFRTDTEVRISVLNDSKFPTKASKYYQALRELNVHQMELVNLLYDYELKKEDMKLIKAQIAEIEYDLETTNYKQFDIEKKNVKLRKKRIELERSAFILKQMKRQADGRKQEVMQWDRILKELEPHLINDNIPIDNPDTHQKVSYTVRFIRQAFDTIRTNSNMSPSESINILGQLETSLRVCNELGLMDTIINHLTLHEKDFLIKSNLVKSLPENNSKLLDN